MTWKFEIIRAFFVAFGAMQTLSNLNYLLQKDGLELAKKQHRELPNNITNEQIKVKTICMFSLGILFLITGLFSYFTRSNYELSFIIVLGVYIMQKHIQLCQIKMEPDCFKYADIYRPRFLRLAMVEEARK